MPSAGAVVSADNPPAGTTYAIPRKDGNIFIGDLSLDQYIDARIRAALGR